MSEANKAVVRRLFDMFNSGDFSAADEVIAPDYAWHGPSGRDVRGVDGWKQLATAYRTAFPDVRSSIEDIIAEGDLVATRWTGRGTHRGSLTGETPTGRAVTVPGLLFTRIADGKIVEEWEQFDEVAMFQAIGVNPGAAAQAT